MTRNLSESTAPLHVKVYEKEDVAIEHSTSLNSWRSLCYDATGRAIVDTVVL